MPVALTWGSYVQTDLKLTEFFAQNHTLSLYIMPQFPYALAASIMSSREGGAPTGWFRLGQGNFAWLPAVCATGNAHAVEGSGASEYLVDAERADPQAQQGWRLCLDCHGLFFAGHGPGVCSAGSGHRAWQPVSYRVLKDPSAASLSGRKVETGWRWCGKCQLLFSPNKKSTCPAGKAHDSTGSGEYALPTRPTSDESGMHAGWQKCHSCAGLMYGGTGTSVDVTVGGVRTNFPRQLLRRGMWHHLALVRQGNTISLYVDGDLAGSSPIAPGVTVPASRIRLGRTVPSLVTGTDQFYGLIDDLALFDRSLNAGQVASLAQRVTPLTGTEIGLVAGWPLSPGPHTGRLARPITLGGNARLVEGGGARNNLVDRALLPIPAPDVALSLPFPQGQAWKCGQSIDDPNGSHQLGASFCLDFFRSDGATDGAPFHAPATGVVVDATLFGLPGPAAGGNELALQTAPAELTGFGHHQFASNTTEIGAIAVAGKKLALTGNTGTRDPHLHTGSFAPSRHMFPAAYTNYEVSWDEGKNWHPVALGVPQPGEWVRNPSAPTHQKGWRWCRRCGCLHFPTEGTANRCSVGGLHDGSDSDVYTLVFQGAGQPDWRWCRRCGVLFFSAAPSRCAAGPAHDPSDSGHYTLVSGGIGHQSNWRWCRNCSSMFFGGDGDADDCPAGTHHDSTGSGNYTILSDAGEPAPFGQTGWLQCRHCGAMFFGAGSRTSGVCPAGQSHDAYPASPEPVQRYTLLHSLSPSLDQQDWWWCHKCQGLFYNGESSKGLCPAGGEHDKTGSSHYRVLRDTPRPGETGWTRCQRCQGMFIGTGICTGGGGTHSGTEKYKFEPRDEIFVTT